MLNERQKVGFRFAQPLHDTGCPSWFTLACTPTRQVQASTNGLTKGTHHDRPSSQSTADADTGGDHIGGCEEVEIGCLSRSCHFVVVVCRGYSSEHQDVCAEGKTREWSVCPEEDPGSGRTMQRTWRLKTTSDRLSQKRSIGTADSTLPARGTNSIPSAGGSTCTRHVITG